MNSTKKIKLLTKSDCVKNEYLKNVLIFFYAKN